MKYLKSFTESITTDNNISTENDFNIIFNSTINKYMKNYNCTIEEINDGFCYDFAEEIQKRMKLPKKDLYILTTPMFSSDYSNQETEAIYKNEINWSKEMLNKYGKPPINMKFYHPDDHAWLVYKNKHYDAETPNGVNIWYELPIFQRYMKRKGFIKESINESKQVGILYHFTSYHNLTEILKSNTLKSFYPYISFTRNKYMNPDADVRIVIDGTKLSHKYKIEPFIYSSMYIDNSYTAPVFKFEAEERIVFFPNLPQRATIKLISELKNISNYIIRIDAVKKRSSDYANIENQFIELSKEHPHIKFNIIDNLHNLFQEPNH